MPRAAQAAASRQHPPLCLRCRSSAVISMEVAECCGVIPAVGMGSGNLSTVDSGGLPTCRDVLKQQNKT